MTQSAIDEAMAKAQEAAKAHTTQVQTEVVPQAATTSVAVAQPSAGVPMSLDDIDQGNLMPDAYLTPTEMGFKVKAFPGELFEEFIAEIDTDDIKVGKSIRFGKNPAKYYKTMDGVMTDDGTKSWAQAVKEATDVDPTSRPYTTAGLPLEVAEDIMSLKKPGEVLIPAGTLLARWTTYTEAQPLSKFNKSLKEAGLAGHKVRVKVTCIPRNGNGNSWGVTQLELIESV